MKIGIVGFSTKNVIPYIKVYEKILNQYHVDYDCIYWDRFNDKEVDKKTMNILFTFPVFLVLVNLVKYGQCLNFNEQ